MEGSNVPGSKPTEIFNVNVIDTYMGGRIAWLICSAAIFFKPVAVYLSNNSV